MSFAATATRARTVAFLCFLAVFAQGVAPATAATGDAKTRELEQRRREIERKKAATASEIDVLKSSDAKLERALAALNANVRNQEASVAAARQAAAAAAAQSAKLRADQERTQARLSDLRGQLRTVAVDKRAPTRLAVPYVAPRARNAHP